MPPTLQSRIKGSIFGVAIVDALGGPVEFKARGTFKPISDFRHNSNFGLAPGTWTDDTSMTLCLGKSLIDSGGVFIPQACIRNYIRWYRDGYLSATGQCFDIGIATRRALDIWSEYFERMPQIGADDTEGHEGGQGEIDRALKRETCCGNGSLMRVAPIALVYFRDMDRALSNAAGSSDVTHPYPTCAECCVVYTRLLVRILHGAGKEELAGEIGGMVFNDEKLKQRLAGCKDLADWGRRKEDEIDSSGFVVSTLDAALWAFFTTSSFESGALRAVNLGWDADTVGAVYGGLAGAFYGVEGIPERWVLGLKRREVVEEVAEGLVGLCQG
ncbi:ADP-ribosylation/Crystallin J1 [Aspergillus egyptiacus]|nr:ADP-ribosylation/Crystallin J1 [Aspergillus egyptiacus]